MQFRVKQASWAGSLVVAMAAILSTSLAAAAGSPVATAQPAATAEAEATTAPAREVGGPIYQSLVDARGGREPAHPGPMPIDEIRRILTEESKKPLFDGVALGWRLAPGDVLRGEGLGRKLSRDCEVKSVDPDTSTEFDFTLTYIPAEIKIRENPDVAKWTCDGDALNVTSLMTMDTPLGEGTLMVYRATWSQRALDLMAPSDRVTEGTINGYPAIFVRPADSEFGLGTEQVIVFEDDAEPDYVVLRVFADNGIPFGELVKLAEGIR